MAKGLLCIAFTAILVGCAGQSAVVPVGPAPAGNSLARNRHLYGSGPSNYITHVVIIIQENRSFDNLFNGFSGANTVQYGKNSKGQSVPLESVPLANDYDLSHQHGAFVTEYANGNLDGFNLEHATCKGGPSGCPPRATAAYAYVPESDVQPYWDMAEQYTVADNMFQTNEGPSFPAHQYLISGASTISNGSEYSASENPLGPDGKAGDAGGCDSPRGSTVEIIDQRGDENRTVYPCFDRLSLMDEANEFYVSWKYYVAKLGPGLWNAPDAIEDIREGHSYDNVIAPSSQVLTDIADNNLASIVWVTPTAAESDHPSSNDGTGPSWVASIVNAIGESPYWNDTAIFVTWDDWGGWYDHVAPTIYNSYELGFRVPLVVISPYAKQGYVSHVQHEFGSILKFTEETFGLPSMGTTDSRADDLSDCFNFGYPTHRHKFKPIRAKYSRAYFLHQPPSNANPDDDW
jgi:phospholipase C